MNYLTPTLGKIYYPAYDDASPSEGDKGGEGGEGKGDGDGSTKTFTQEELNSFLADDRRKHQGVVTGLQAEIDALSKRSNLSQKDRTELETRLTELNGQLLTKEELRAQEREKESKAHAEEVTSLTARADAWQNRYEGTRTLAALSEAAVKHNAINPNQVVTMLRNSTRVVEVMDGEQATGEYEVRVKLDTLDKKGKPVQLDLTPVEAVKHMSEQEDSLNLFKSDSANGYGSRRSKTNQVDAADLAKDPEAYRKARKEGTI